MIFKRLHEVLVLCDWQSDLKGVYMINLASSADKNFLPYTYVMLFSMLQQHHEEAIRFFLLHDGLNGKDLQPFHDLCSNSGNQFVSLVINAGEFVNFQKISTSKYWPLSAYFRLRLMENLPADVDRILYLDGDIIVNNNLLVFYYMDMGDNLIAACSDMTSLETSSMERRLSSWMEPFLSLLRNERYFNSGVMLYDVERYRKKYHENPYFRLFPKYAEQILCPDQDLLNLAHQDETLLLDPMEYNCMPYVAYRVAGKSYTEIKSEAKILHFAGRKPWESGNHIHYPAEKIWWETAFETIYSDELQMAFLESSLSDKRLEEEVRELYQKNSELKEGLAGIKSSLEKIMGTVY